MTSRKEWTDEDVRAEIAEAVRIVAEDREKARYRELHGKYGSGDQPPADDGNGPKPPPAKDEPSKPKKRTLYWGERDEDE